MTILEKLSQTVESLAELRTITGVGKVRLDIGTGGKLDLAPTSGTESIPGIFSEVNLVSGDIKTLIDEKFSDPDNPILKLHQSQSENGRKIITNNVQTIISLAKTAGTELKDVLNKESQRT